MKMCKGCGCERPLEEMAVLRRVDGEPTQWAPWCREHYNERSRRYRSANPKTLARDRGRRRPPEQLRATNLRQNYGITPADYEEMFEAQNGGCWICGAPPRSSRKHLDVDHFGGKGADAVVRGLLCNACNLGIGKLKHDPATLQRAIDYLARS